MKIVTSLSFRGECREAFEFYAKVLGGEIIAAMRLTWARMKLVMEPSCAVPLAALMKNRAQFQGKRVGVVITGGNVDLDRLPWMKGV